MPSKSIQIFSNRQIALLQHKNAAQNDIINIGIAIANDQPAIRIIISLFRASR